MINLEVERIRRELRAEYGCEPDAGEPERTAIVRHARFIYENANEGSLEELMRAHRAIGAALKALGGDAVSVSPRPH